ncbi:hypothetical protein Tco_0303592, partial [Tanacetum coccineum]
MSTPDYIYPIIIPSNSNVEDAFSSKNTPDYSLASSDYSPASLRNTSSDPSEDLSKDLLASLAISPFHDDPYMKIKPVSHLQPSRLNMSGPQDEHPPPPPPPQETQQTPHTVSTIKLPILKKGEYDIWAMKM